MPEGSQSKTGARIGRPVDADADLTRMRILAAARTDFGDLGYAATTYRLLADRTGLAPSALYNYFSSKSDLYEAVYREVQMEAYGEFVLPAIDGTTTFSARLDALLTAAAQLNEASPEAARFLAVVRADAARHEELARLDEELPRQRTELYGELVDLGIRTGEIPAESRESVMALLETMGVGLVEMSSQPELHRAAVASFRALLTRTFTSQ